MRGRGLVNKYDRKKKWLRGLIDTNKCEWQAFTGERKLDCYISKWGERNSTGEGKGGESLNIFLFVICMYARHDSRNLACGLQEPRWVLLTTYGCDFVIATPIGSLFFGYQKLIKRPTRLKFGMWSPSNQMNIINSMVWQGVWFGHSHTHRNLIWLSKANPSRSAADLSCVQIQDYQFFKIWEVPPWKETPKLWHLFR